jgi:hypothetical protein
MSTNKPTRSWREVLKVHPVADLLPRMSATQFDELIEVA